MYTHRYEATVEFGRPLDHPRDDPDALADLARKHATRAVVEGRGVAYEIADVTVDTDAGLFRVVINADAPVGFKRGRFRRAVIEKYNDETNKPSMSDWDGPASYLASRAVTGGHESVSDFANRVKHGGRQAYRPSDDEKREALEIAEKYRQLPGDAPDLTLDGYHLRTLAGETA